MTSPELQSQTVCFTLDDQQVSAGPEDSILQVALRLGVQIPHLCYREGLRADGNCRVCMVEVNGERALAASCCRRPTAGMVVSTNNPRVKSVQRGVLELLQTDMPVQPYTLHNELDDWCERLSVQRSSTETVFESVDDLSHPGIAVHLQACIQCKRCLQACREVQVNDVIGYAGRGSEARIVFDFDDPMGDSSCVGCGECVQVCPTGALVPATARFLVAAEKEVASICPYCGVGCLLTYHVRDHKILHISGRKGPANAGRLCVKGRFGFDYVSNRQRLTKPLIRRADAPKSTVLIDPAHPEAVFREATWQEALDFAATGLKAILECDGIDALAGLGSAKGSCEEAYLFQKLVRCGFHSNHVDHCTRLCHASSVAALLEGIGSGAVSNPMADVTKADVILITGANPTVNHPVGATWMKNAIKNGTDLILLDPRKTDLSRHARWHLQFNPASDVALVNAMMHVIIEEDLIDEAFITAHTEGFEALKAHLQDYSPAMMSPVCGIDEPVIREVARAYATANNAMILWGMGVSQHVHGTDNARCLIALCMITGQIGRPGAGLHPLRGQNNVQGASDVGLIPMVFPDYQRVDNPLARERFERLWQTELNPKPGLTTVEIMNHAHDGQIKGLYIVGENPAMSDPDSQHTRAALAKLEHLVVQDIFLTETAGFADVVLPATAFAEKTGTFINSDRTVQLGRQAIDPPGDARPDLWIIQQLARHLGLDWPTQRVEDVFDEMRQCMDSIAGITWDRLQHESVTYPCKHEGDTGSPVLFHDGFPTASGKAKLFLSAIVPPAELPDRDYPWVLITGRQLEHWHTGSMTRRSTVLNELEPEPWVAVHPTDLQNLGIPDGGLLQLTTRRGSITLHARSDESSMTGSVFMPFCYYEAAANILTNPALDPVAKIAEVKYCAVNLTVGK